MMEFVSSLFVKTTLWRFFLRPFFSNNWFLSASWLVVLYRRIFCDFFLRTDSFLDVGWLLTERFVCCLSGNRAGNANMRPGIGKLHMEQIEKQQRGDRIKSIRFRGKTDPE